MTTLSKEDVVRTDNDLLAMIQKHFPSLPLDDRYTDWGKWLRFAKAVYSHGEQAARADLVAENERLKFALADTEALELGTAERLTATRTALAAAGAWEIAAINCIDELIGLLVRPFCDSASAKRAAALINTPRDDSALREMIAGVYEECAKVCEDDAKGWTDYSCEMAARDCADAIRALAEKAKGE